MSAGHACRCTPYAPFRRYMLCIEAEVNARLSCLIVCRHILLHMVVRVSTEGGWMIVCGRFYFFMPFLSSTASKYISVAHLSILLFCLDCFYKSFGFFEFQLLMEINHICYISFHPLFFCLSVFFPLISSVCVI